MAAATLPIKIGTASANACHKADLGRTFVVDGITYRIMKSTSAIAAAASKVVVDVLSSGQSTNACVTTTTASNYLVCGVIPAGQTGSTGTTGLIADDYLPVIVNGKNVAVICNSATLLAGDPIGTATDAGNIAIHVTTSLASLQGGVMGYATLLSTIATTTTYCKIVRIL